MDELLAVQATPQAIQGLIEQFTKTVLELALAGELTHHLGYAKHDKEKTDNARNATSRKPLKTLQGELELAIPRDRNARFEPQIVAKHQTRWDGFDEMISSLYSRGLTVREIQSHLQEIYGVEVAPDFILTVTESVAEAVKAGRNRSLKAVYPVVGFDALMIKIRHQNQIHNRADLIVKSWRANWERITPIFGYPAELRKIVYTTNAIESLNMSLRKIIKNRAAFPSEEAAYKLLYLALQNIAKK